MVLSGLFNKLEDSGAFLLKVALLTLLVFFFHVPPFIAILSLTGIVFVILTEASPRVEIVPETEEFRDGFDGHRRH
jgi:hypothetical protein